MDFSSILSVVLGCLFLTLLPRMVRKVRGGVHLPPGPKENYFKPRPFMYRIYDDLSKVYGPVYSLKRGRDIFVVIASYQAALDIMQKHGADLLDRPRSVAGGEILSGGMRALLLGAGERLKRVRRALHAGLQPSVSNQYGDVQLNYAKHYIRNILDEPDKHLEHTRTYAGSVIMSLTYGKTTPSLHTDPEIRLIKKSVDRMLHCTKPGTYLVDTFPFLRHFPFGSVRDLRTYHQEELSLFSSHINNVSQQMSEGTAHPSFTTYLLEHQAGYRLSRDELAYVAGSMYGAGSDTTASGLGIITMAAACFPEELASVQRELDSVVGRDRLPTFEDQADLPRVAAFVFEAHRWRPITPGGFAHRAVKDVPWKDFVIPAGAIVVGNNWSIMHDPEVFPEPEDFKPDRWLDEKGNIRDNLKHFDFGFGRRVCPGQYLAERSLFINAALLCWAFDITDDPAFPINTMAFTDAAIVHPLPFKANLKPRIPNLRTLIEPE